ncbi:MAG: hypothetical protein KDB68_13295 [Planctomycetes bacterium]|nr:hypothetical protein [Planctomycetota bacterium]MCA8937168.1 hypothetical protein [Planctomycetota bacterium]
MSDELAPEGLELQPDGMGFDEEAGSEDASHLLPPIRELPQDREFLPGAFYTLQTADGTPANPPQQLGEILGTALFQSLTDVHLFGRNSDAEPWLEVGPMSPEPVQILVGQELFPVSGEPLAEDDLEMFEMVAGRVAKTLKRDKQAPKEDAAAGAARSQKLGALKGTLGDKFGMSVAGNFQLADVTDCCLSLGLKRTGNAFAWYAGKSTGDPILTVTVDGAELTKGATGTTSRVNLTFTVAAVTQPRKVLERTFAGCYYFQKRLGGDVQMDDGSAPTDAVARGEHARLEATIKKIEDAGLRAGHVVTKRLT